jgi:hypothetical protein
MTIETPKHSHTPFELLFALADEIASWLLAARVHWHPRRVHVRRRRRSLVPSPRPPTLTRCSCEAFPSVPFRQARRPVPSRLSVQPRLKHAVQPMASLAVPAPSRGPAEKQRPQTLPNRLRRQRQQRDTGARQGGYAWPTCTIRRLEKHRKRILAGRCCSSIS